MPTAVTIQELEQAKHSCDACKERERLGELLDELQVRAIDEIDQSRADFNLMLQRLISQEAKTRLWQQRAEIMKDLVNAAIDVADSISYQAGGRTATVSPPACAALQQVVKKYRKQSEGEP